MPESEQDRRERGPGVTTGSALGRNIDSARHTVHHLTAISIAGLFVGLIAAFATVGFVELVQYLNDNLFVSTAARAGRDTLQLTIATIAVLTPPKFGGSNCWS